MKKLVKLNKPAVEVLILVETKKLKLLVMAWWTFVPTYQDLDINDIKINERVSFRVLKNILETAEDTESVKKALKANIDNLIPKNIILDDIYASISYFINLCENVGTVDDIDHLGNRRIRSVGELLQSQFRIGFARMERVIRERMGLQSQDMEKVLRTPHQYSPCRCGD